MACAGTKQASFAGRASSAGLPPLEGRFLVWRGASGRSYAFSPVDDETWFEEALLIAVRRDPEGRLVGAVPVGAADRGVGEIWAHHLATTAAARRMAALDLVAATQGPETFGGRDGSARGSGI